MAAISKKQQFTDRQVTRIVSGLPTSDGAGVELTRVIGQPGLNMLDPFLMLDVFRSDKPQDYIAGFPPHPHRGFDAVSYLLNGRMRHKDSAGHEGIIEAGDVQWMSAGRGIVHSEMPEQENGLLEGFQLWINLPAKHKMDEPRYQEFPADNIPVEKTAGGSELKVIAGTTSTGTTGPVKQPLTDPLYLDIKMKADDAIIETIESGHNAFVYVISGEVAVGDAADENDVLRPEQLAILSQGELVRITASKDSRLLLLAGKPLGEPVARGGPFVMNTQAEIEQAFSDYKNGLF